ncbi:single-stranded DNA-binding protein [Flavobacterium sp. xlx-214]|uniref:single-stranded DNA-binding protein n=1 Tax=unclassified Flavobacterium TaxID=196869 RepID=UPI0013D5F01F|nr:MULTISPECIES: single-stranded DNA-binding protein [unclassified Flavobacterium]MBA5793490.1 single-stranded DNA-binding protein [Flavobacterium sp. xlx-221]QMI82740.1 single-stranded DNA-binding protein [Flavobacterium sp. xlx-214]
MNIIGRLTKNAEVRTLSNEKQVVNFSIATNEYFKNKLGERVEQTTYFDCSYWISTRVASLLTKGTLVELIGRVSTRAWVNKDGEARAGLNFHTSQIKLHSSGKNNYNQSNAISENKNSNHEQKEDDLPF